ncbi:MAG: polymerase LigD, ligase domain protein [Pelosinus sp.]|jgi:bifunctional non-homologous end joining protein LigD|nr:polymerase LigD, ligase domain protein [Pelosinus sp.]
MKLIKPMLAKLAKLPLDDDQYSFEIKWDGLRAILYSTADQITIASRNLKDITSQYPELQQLRESLLEQQVILDGEIIAFDKKGQPSFSLLQRRMGLNSPTIIKNKMIEIPITYIIFDILHLNQKSLVDLPYTERRHILENLNLAGANWQTPAFQQGSGKEILTAVSALGLEGIVAKRLTSSYTPGKRSGDWLKIKNQHRQELVIGGWLPGKGQRSGGIGSLLLGYYDITRQQAKKVNKEQHFLYAGKVGTGFTKDVLHKLLTILTPLQRSTSPFVAIPFPNAAIFVEPELVGEFEFTEWTPNSTLRHPSFKGLRDDKLAHDVIREI